MNIAILGYGVVGKGVEELCKRNGINISHILMHPSFELTKSNMTYDMNDILNDNNTDLVVECMGGLHPAYDYVAASIKSGKHAVSSNKKMLAKYLNELNDLCIENKVHLLFSSSCGGGIPWLKELSAISNTDKIDSYMGIMNGTSNYILYKMSHDKCDFAVALKEAQSLGYAEADPSDDIDGIDTANKTVLSAAIAFRRYFDLEDVYIKGIRYIGTEDLNYALDNNYQLALIGKGINKDGRYTLTVMPSFIPKSKIIGNISLNNNCFTVNCDSLGEASFIGQGAGSLPTASNIIRDIKSIDNPYLLDIEDKGINDDELSQNTYYIRTVNDINEKYIK
ncbi:MAG: homoserine dehydrogenase [Erysipelotrichaceae bacterium]|nr:homoserine dehydrogenase [Erysipelotrichaceae bacterium]